MENEVEIWKGISGFEEFYRISSFGRVFSIRAGVILKPNYDTDGYVQYGLHVNSIRKVCKAHHLVVRAFIDSEFKTMGGLVCDHINRKRDDNRVSNLRVVSYRDNAINRYSKSLTGTKYEKYGYQSNINHNGIRYYLGFFQTEKEAHAKYMEAYLAIKNGVFCYEKIKTRRTKGSSKYRGVYYLKKYNKWMGNAKIGNRWEYLGLFNNEEDANIAILKRENVNCLN